MPQNRLPRVMKYYSPTHRRNHGRPLKRFLDMWDRNGSTSGTTPRKIYDDDEQNLALCWKFFKIMLIYNCYCLLTDTPYLKGMFKCKKYAAVIVDLCTGTNCLSVCVRQNLLHDDLYVFMFFFRKNNSVYLRGWNNRTDSVSYSEIYIHNTRVGILNLATPR